MTCRPVVSCDGCHHGREAEVLDVEGDEEEQLASSDAKITTAIIDNKRNLHMGVTHSSSLACIWLPLNI